MQQEPPKLVQVIVVEPDADVARAIARLAFETLSREATLVVGAASSFEGARIIIERAVRRADARLVVLCPPHLADGDSGFDLVAHLASADADARVVLLTSGERDELLRALRMRVDGIVAKPVALPELRSILRFVSQAPVHAVARASLDADDQAPLTEARDALEAALDAVDDAETRLRSAGERAPYATRHAVQEARRLAAEAYRRVLEAEREMEERREPA